MDEEKNLNAKPNKSGDSFLKDQKKQLEEKGNDQSKDKIKKVIIKVIIKVVVFILIKILAPVIIAAILIASFLDFLDGDGANQANDAKPATVQTTTTYTGGTVEANQVVITPSADNGKYEIKYNNSEENIKDAKNYLETNTQVSAENFTEYELAIINAFVKNGAEFDYYTEEELHCIPYFIKAEACTQNLDLRPNSEKQEGKTTGGYVDSYQPRKIEDLAENEIPGTILVQRTNTNSTTPITLEYKAYNDFMDLKDGKNGANKEDVLKYFTIDENGNLVIAKWEHVLIKVEGQYPASLDEAEKDIDKNEYEINTEPIAYKQYITDYTMPFEFLVQLLMRSDDPQFCMELIEYVLNSKIVINIQEEQTVIVTDEERIYTVHSKENKNINYQVNAAGQQIVKEDNYLLKYAMDDEEQKKDDVDKQNNCTSYSKTDLTVKVHTEYTSHSYVFEIVERDTWIERYKKTYTNLPAVTQPTSTVDIESDGQYKKVELAEPQPSTNTESINNDADVNRFINETNSNYQLQPEIESPVECVVSSLNTDKFEKIDLKNKVDTTVTEYQANSNLLPENYIYAVDTNGNYEKFLVAYNNSPTARNSLKSWEVAMYRDMEKNESTKGLVNYLKYLLYKYDGQDRGVTELSGLNDAFIPSQMKNANTNNSFNQFTRYMHEFEGGGNLPTYKNESGEECYKVQSDGSENGLAVGYGVDIGTHGSKLATLGYDITEGALIPVEVVNTIEKEEINQWLEYIESEMAELDLTQYQIYALTSRAYNCGYDSINTANSSEGLNFVETFKKYWNKETDDKYEEDPSTTDFNHKLYTTFMAKPVTAAEGEYLAGLENRRKSEWCLFQTGYYGYDLLYGAGNGIDEYCSSNAIDFTNNINLYNEDGSVNPNSIQQLENWITNDLLNTKIHKKNYAMQNGPFEKWWDTENNEFTQKHKFQCTWYAYGRANQFLELYGTTYKKWPGSRGNAYTWYNAKDNGGQKYFECGSVPRANSIVVWKSNPYGHVAFVEAVDTVNNIVYISHAGGGKSWLGITEYNIEEMKTLWGYELLGYVYLDSPK